MACTGVRLRHAWGLGGRRGRSYPDQSLGCALGLSVGWAGWLGWSGWLGLGRSLGWESGFWPGPALARSLAQNASTPSFPPAAVMRAWNAGFSNALPWSAPAPAV